MRFNPILAIIISCISIFSFSDLNAQNKITAAQISMTTTGYFNGESAILINDSIDIYYYQDLILYKLTYTKTHGVPADSDEPIIEEIRNIWFVHEANKKNGYAFYEEKEKPDSWENVDSFVRGHGMPQVGPFGLDTNTSITKLSSKQLPGKIMQEEYINKDPANSKDTMCFAFSEPLKHIPFSFDKQLDKARGKKLCQIKMTGGLHLSPDNNKIHRSSVVIELKEIPVHNQQKVLSYFAAFRSLKKQ